MRGSANCSDDLGIDSPSSPNLGVDAAVCSVFAFSALFLYVACPLHKVCIHQTDGNLKKKGVAHFGVVLFFTGQLLILESDDCMKRVWTVYEFATFLSLHPQNRIVMLPVNLLQYVFVGSTVTVIVELVTSFLFSTAANTIFPVAVTLGVFMGPLLHFAGFILLDFSARHSAVAQRRRMVDLLHRFSVGSAECSNEDDRVPVLGHAGGVSQEETVLYFDKTIREHVPETIRSSVGCSGVPYSHVLLFSLCFLGEGFDAAGSEIGGTSFREAFLRSWIYFAWHFGGFPRDISVDTSLPTPARFVSSHVPRGGDDHCRRRSCRRPEALRDVVG